MKSRIEKSTACSLVIVLGMHRSGTSAITRGLQALGANLGDTLMPPVPGNNDKGFWEDIDINALNIEMLKTVGGDWFSLTPVGMPDIELLRSQGFLLRATELLREKMNASAVFAFKDPRVAKLLPFWNQAAEHLRVNAGYVLALRNPLSVAKSLAKRDHLFAEHSYLLWLGHVLESLRGSEGKPRVMVDYDRLMQNPDVELGRVACALHLEMDAAEFEDYKTNFLDHQLQHTVYQPEDLWLDNSCPPIVREIYARLLDVASDRTSIDDPVLGSEIRKWLQEFERFSAGLKLADKQLERLTSQHQALAEREGQISSLNQAIHERDAQRGSLQQTLAEREGQLAGLQQAVAQKDAQIEGQAQALAERDAQIGNLGQIAAERDRQIASLNQAIHERDAQLGALQQALAEREGQLAGLQQAVAQKDAQIEGQAQALAERDRDLATLTHSLSAYEVRIDQLEKAAEEQTRRIQKMRNALAQADTERQSIEDALREKDTQIVALTEELEKIKEEIHLMENERQFIYKSIESSNAIILASVN